ncbi:MAG: ATP-binding cassette domain-containing protein [Lachnospiraceae bacterium]
MSILEINNLSFSYDGGTTPVFEHVSFRLDTDWRLGFTGRNGRGKTTFLKLLLGEYEYSGTIRCAVPFVYYPFSVTDESAWVCDIASELLGEENMWRFRKELSALGVSEEATYRPYRTLSGGEQTKVFL